MQKDYDSLKRQVSGFLADASSVYFKLGFALRHGNAEPSDAESQAAIGNLGTGVELAVKAFLAGINPALVFKDLPSDARVFFHAPADVPDGFNRRPFELDLKDFAYATIPFEEAVKAFYVFFPDKKQALRPYFRLLLDLRELSLHASLGKVERHELDKTVYLAVCIAELLRLDPRTAASGYAPDEADRKFVKAFDEKRAREVRQRLAAAREKAPSLKVDISYNEPPPREGWEGFEARCPVCKNWGVLSGATDIRCEGEHESLEFAADAFECDACGLCLEDMEELRLGDIPRVYDRSEDLARWREECAHGAQKNSA